MSTTNKEFQNTILQFKWKLAKHQPKIMSLIIINIMLVFLGGLSGSLTYSSIGSVELRIVDYSVAGFLFIECLLMFIYGVLIVSPIEWKTLSNLPMTRTTVFLSNVGFLFVLSLLNTVLTYCNIYITSVIQSWSLEGVWLFSLEQHFSVSSVFAVFTLYWMACSFGYALTSISEASKTAVVIIVGVIFLFIFRQTFIPIFVNVFMDGGIFILTLKYFGLTVLAFVTSYLFTRRQEVNV